MLTEVINNHELAEVTLLIKTDCWAAQLTPSEVEALRKRKAAHKLYLSEKSESRKIERDQLNREMKRITSECKERAVETILKRFEKQLDDCETRMAYKILNKTLPTYMVTWCERNKKMSGPSKSQFQGHYQKLSKQRLTQNITVLEALSKEPNSSEDFCKQPNEAKVRTTLRTLKSGKAPGKSAIVPEMLKALEKELSPLLTKVFQSIWTERTKIPHVYKDAKVVSLFRKGPKTDPNNYRSLFMLEAEGKLLCKIIKSRVQSGTDHKLDKFQFGFRKRRSTLQAIWGLRENLEKS